MENLIEPWKVLTENAYEVFVYLNGLRFIEDFYLAGGTGLALRIGHRISVDFDFFSEKISLSLQYQNVILQKFSSRENFIIEFQEEGTLKVRWGGTLVSFFYYPYPLVGSLEKVQSLNVASIEDIALMKIAAIIGRGSKKDFIDLYFIIRDYFDLRSLLELGQKKFKDVRDFPLQAMKALIYFEDAEKEKLPEMLKEVSWDEIKKFFSDAVRKQIQSEL